MRKPAWATSALLVDWAVIVALVLVSQLVASRYPYVRDESHYVGDPEYGWPIQKEQVPVPLLDALAYYLPAGVAVVISAARRSLHEVHNSLIAITAGRALMRITVECIKNRVGRLRPSFFARCQWDLATEACTGLPLVIKEGRKSFPSGHSSTAFQGLFFLSLFVAGKTRAFSTRGSVRGSSALKSRLLALSVSLSPLFLAGWIAITRLEDHWHHTTDVLAGSLIGLVAAFVTYVMYWPNPLGRDSLDAARSVYEQDDNAIALADVEQEEV